jgi:hypothetical protein
LRRFEKLRKVFFLEFFWYVGSAQIFFVLKKKESKQKILKFINPQMETKRTFIPPDVNTDRIKETREGPNGSKFHILPRTSFYLEFECLFENEKLVVWVWARPDGIDFADDFAPEKEPGFSVKEIFEFAQNEWKLQFPRIPLPQAQGQTYYAPDDFKPPTRALEQFPAGDYLVSVLPLSKSQNTITDDPEFDFVLSNDKIWALMNVGFSGFTRSCRVPSLDPSQIENWDIVKSAVVCHFIDRSSVYISNRNNKNLPFCQPLWEKNQHLHPDPLVRSMSPEKFHQYLHTPISVETALARGNEDF